MGFLRQMFFCLDLNIGFLRHIHVYFICQVNTTETSITQLATHYTKDELEFFKKLVNTSSKYKYKNNMPND